MKVALKVLVFPLALLALETGVATAADSGAGSAAAALKNLEAARANLAKAVKRIEVDPPNNEDLEAAHTAVGALKEAIDAGAELEPKDLDYAKAALAARKELRTSRDYVDQRRANVHIHNARRELDRAMAGLGERVQRLSSRDPSGKDFEDAKGAVEAVRKILEEARPFAKQDPKFADYVESTDAILNRQQKAIDDRWVQLAAGKQRGLLQESRKALAEAVGVLGKTSTDAQFEAAERASNIVNKRLDEGKPLEPRDDGYRADADRARAEVAQARKRIDDAWSATGLERLKAEIEPARKDLANAGKAVRGREVTQDQLAEARTAAIVVRKLVEKYQAQASRNQAATQYLSEVKASLADVEMELSRRGIDAARLKLSQALRALERRAPADEQFEEANQALVALEKTLEGVRARGDAALAKSLDDAKTLAKNARPTMALRRVQADVQRQRAKIDEARKAATAAVSQIQKANVANEELQAAENAVKQLRAMLDEGAPLTKKDHDYSVYDKETRERANDLAGRIANRKILLAASEGRSALNEAVAAARAKLDAARQPESSDADVEGATQAVEVILQGLASRAGLEKQDKGYAAQANKARGELKHLMEQLELAKQARALRKRTADALAAGGAAADAASSAKDLRGQRDAYEKALSQFKSCETGGAAMLQENPPLAGVALLVDGKTSTPKDVISQCTQRRQATQKLYDQVTGLIRFEDGPKKALEQGKSLLSMGRRAEALAQFDECVATGRILEHDNPEVRDRKFEVGGASMTLAEVIKQCFTHQKSLRAK